LNEPRRSLPSGPTKRGRGDPAYASACTAAHRTAALGLTGGVTAGPALQQRPAGAPAPAPRPPAPLAAAQPGASPVLPGQAASARAAAVALDSSAGAGATAPQHAWCNPLYQRAPALDAAGAPVPRPASAQPGHRGLADARARPASAPSAAAPPPPLDPAAAPEGSGSQECSRGLAHGRPAAAGARPGSAPVGLPTGRAAGDAQAGRDAALAVVAAGGAAMEARHLLTAVLPSAGDAALHASVAHLRAALRCAELRLANAQGEVRGVLDRPCWV